MTSNTKKNVVFSCSPNLGALDSWLPVIYKFREKNKNANFVIFIPTCEILSQVNTESALIKIAENIFDVIIFTTDNQNYFIAESFHGAVKNQDRSSFLFNIERGINHIHAFIGSKIVKFLLAKLKRVDSKMKDAKLSATSPGIEYLHEIATKYKSVVLYDIFEHQKPYLSWFISNFNSVRKYSLPRAIHLVGYDIKNKDLKCIDTENVFVFMYSEIEREFYKSYFDLNDNALVTTGIPRHDPGWLKFLKTYHSYENSKKIPFTNYIFVISRNALTGRFPMERKLQSIKNILKIAQKYDLPVVVKLHPKEKNDGVYERVFGRKNYGVTWVYSEDHPYAIAQNSLFAVVFVSGVSLDMIKLGVPVVELLNLKGLRKYDNCQSLRDINDQPILSRRKLGFVLGASSYDDLDSHVSRILQDRKHVGAELQSNYERVFGNTVELDRIVSDLSRALS